MPVVVRRPAPPLDGPVTSITYRSGQQPRTSIEKILPGPDTGLWVNLNRELAGVTPTEYLRSRANGPNHLLFPSRACSG